MKKITMRTKICIINDNNTLLLYHYYNIKLRATNLSLLKHFIVFFWKAGYSGQGYCNNNSFCIAYVHFVNVITR